MKRKNLEIEDKHTSAAQEANDILFLIKVFFATLLTFSALTKLFDGKAELNLHR